MSSLLGSDPHKVRKEVEFPYRVLHALSQAAAPLSDLALPTQTALSRKGSRAKGLDSGDTMAGFKSALTVMLGELPDLWKLHYPHP